LGGPEPVRKGKKKGGERELTNRRGKLRDLKRGKGKKKKRTFKR